ncbi:hypothetical protein IVB46_11600 [Bradyrhizobium sp. 61]|uniref:hypothetical protein n=1 Tax=unclassified Bradyrhizobium TaxID=2631580 RepID=UPI001FFA1B99|nr:MULTISPECIES: hypothetical protein [unclassified Bradyrhizobium]MCK1275876.1 hypothetical protein [Bradyrhizobium sp. 61]MCK1443112.1 hypothetical protein [Bradyrhizobium sp. 48]MCK1460580.1 hypothetical protein [Bradyrhizobium sp. 2]
MTGPVAQFRMAQLVDYDLRLTDPARTVYRFMIGWYMHAKYGDALASVRHIVKTMRDRAPDGARHLSRSAVQRAIMLLIKCGWLVRTHTGKGRGGSRYVPVLNVLELAAQGTLPISVPDHRDATEIPLVSHSTGTAVSHSTGTQSDLASHITGTKTLLLDPPTDGSTEREIDPATPAAPLLADGLAATAAGGTAVEERADTPAAVKPSFEALWRAYAHAKGKIEARKAWDALPAEMDRTAVIKAAAAWQASWAAQGKPDAPRYTLARWLKDERYDESPPTGYVKPEKASKAKQAKPKAAKQPSLGLGINIKRYTITAHETEGSAFADYWETFTFRRHDDGYEFTQRMYVLKADADADEAPDFYRKMELIKGTFGKGNPAGKWVGRVLGINEGEEGDLGFHYLPDENPPAAPEPEPVVAPPPSKPWTEADEAALRARIYATPSAPRDDYGTREWERRYQERQERAAGRREWDAAHPELFEDKPSGPVREITVAQYEAHAGVPFDHDDDGAWPAWMDAEYEEDDAA